MKTINNWELLRIKEVFHFAEKIYGYRREEKVINFKRLNGFMIAYRYNGRDQSSWLNPRGLKSNPNYLREKLT